MLLAAADAEFYSTFSKIDDSFFLVLLLLGFVAVVLRVRRNGVLATVSAVLGLAFLGLPMLYWTLQAFDAVDSTNEYVWAAAQAVFDLGFVFLLLALVLPRVGGLGSPKTPPAPQGVPAWQPQGPGIPAQGQPPVYGAYAPPPAQPTSPPPGWQTPPQQ